MPATPSSQMLLLVGTVFLLLLMFGYTAFVYWMLRGKIRPREGYHLGGSFCWHLSAPPVVTPDDKPRSRGEAEPGSSLQRSKLDPGYSLARIPG